MPQKSKFRQSPQRKELEIQLATGQITQTEAAKRIGMDQGQVSRYMKNELGPEVQKQVKADSEAAHALNVINALVDTRLKTLNLYQDALTLQDTKDKVETALRAIHEEVRVLETIAKVTGQMGASSQTQVNVFGAEVEVEITQVILGVLNRYPNVPPGLKEAMADALLSNHATSRDAEEYIDTDA
jgi:predicted transcriptional regulator